MSKSIGELEAELGLVNAQIADHPLNSGSVQASNEIIESAGVKDVSEISRELSQKELPTLEELGRATLSNVGSFAKLHRRRRKLERRIERMKSR